MFINKDLVSGIEVLMFLRANGEVGFDACPMVGTARWPDREGSWREGGAGEHSVPFNLSCAWVPRCHLAGHLEVQGRGSARERLHRW